MNRNRRAKHRATDDTKKFFGRISFRTFALSLVALIQIALLLIGATYSWVETISSIKFDGAKGDIDKAVKTVANISDSTSKDIDLDAYFKKAGNVHLSACSSADGENFYFPIIGETSSYRLSSINDNNVNYINFSFDVKNKNASERAFRFNEAPTVDDNIRVAISTADTSPVILANKASTGEVVASTNGGKSTTEVHAFSEFLTPDTSVFKVGANETKTVTIKLWLQEGGSLDSDTVSMTNFKLISGESQKSVTVDYGIGSDSTMGTIATYNGEGPAKTCYGKDGDTITLTAEPKENYKFMGWFTDEDCTTKANLTGNNPTKDKSTINFTMGDKSLIFFAKFKPICTVTAEASKATVDGAEKYLGTVKIDSTSGTRVTTKNYACGEEVTISATPITGYKFVGWYTSDKYTDEFNISDQATATVTLPEETSVTYYALFLPKEVKVTASVKNKTGGTVSADGYDTGYEIVATVNYDSSITFTATRDSDNGYLFDGWYSDAGCTTPLKGTEYTINDNVCTVKVNKESQLNGVHIYAKFKLKTYTVNVYAKNYYNNEEQTANKYGLVNYNDSASGYQLKYENITVTFGGKMVFTAKDQNDYCTFDGWYSDSNYSEESKVCDTETYTIAKFTDDSPTTLYAKYTVNKKTISVETVTGTGDTSKGTIFKTGVAAGSSVTQKCGETVTLKAEPSDNYDFVGWYKDAECTDANLYKTDAETSFTVNNKTLEKFYAKFKIKTKTITVVCKPDDNSGTATINGKSSDTIDYGTKATLVATPNDDNDYLFDGWYTDSSLSNQLSTDTTYELTVDGNTATTIYASFVKKPITITVHPVKDDSTDTSNVFFNHDGQSGTVRYGDRVTLSAEASANSEFKGWYTDENCTEKVSDDVYYSFTVDKTTKTEYYAKFEKRTTLTLYFKNTSNWNNIYIYMWGSNGNNKGYPGDSTLVERIGTSQYYKFDVDLSKGYTNIIFNPGSDSGKTSDLTLPTVGDTKNCYNYQTKQWEEYKGETPATTYTIYLTNNKGWTNPYCYAWNSSGEKNAAFPGVKMTDTGDKNDQNQKIYKIEISSAYTGIVFNQGNYNSQSVDVTDFTDGMAYYLKDTTDSKGHFQVGTWNYTPKN